VESKLNKKSKGSITVFISIVLGAIFLVVGVFADGARLELAESQLERVNKLALSSVLAYYNNSLQKEYGLFGVTIGDESITETFEEYFEKNIGTNIANGGNLYNFSTEEISLDELENLENRRVFEGQVEQFMKYRAPYEMAADLSQKISGMKNISKGAKLCKRKLKIERKASEIGDLQTKLDKKAGEINSYSFGSIFSETKKKFESENTKLEAINNTISECSKLYALADSETRQDIMNDISTLSNEASKINTNIDKLKNAVAQSISDYKQLNSLALEQASSIKDKLNHLDLSIDEELNYANEQKNEISEIAEGYQNDLTNMKSMIKEDTAYNMIDTINKNITKCDSAITDINKSAKDFCSVLDNFTKGDMINYSYNKNTSNSSSSQNDTRKDIENNLKQTLNKESKTKSISVDLLNKLPSRKADQEEPSGNTKWNNLNFDDAQFLDDDLSELSDKESILRTLADNVRDTLYLNEYIMGTFKHNVPLLENENPEMAYNLRSEDKTKRASYFDNYEVEYIINGNRNESTNLFLIKSEILSIRMVANLIHIYTDSSKMTRVSALAAALSSWSAGLSTPLIQTMLVCAWAMAESIYDLDCLTKGQKVMFFKTQDHWKTDISGKVLNNDRAKADNKSLLYLSYQDYLRLFLLFMNKDTKISRIQDLIQLDLGVDNTDFLLEDCTTCLKASTKINYNNLFVSLPKKKMTISKSLSMSY
jgi:hypothetical protein